MIKGKVHIYVGHGQYLCNHSEYAPALVAHLPYETFEILRADLDFTIPTMCKTCLKAYRAYKKSQEEN